MLATSDLIALIERNPNGMTTEQVASEMHVNIGKAIGRLSKANAYGLISKRRAEQGKCHNAALWVPKVKATP